MRINSSLIASETYSTSEKVVGIWTDNKNIYRKVTTGNNLSLPSNQWVETGISIPNKSFIIEASIINNENGQAMPLSAFVSNGKLSIMNLRTVTVNYNSGYTIIAEYKKATD